MMITSRIIKVEPGSTSRLMKGGSKSLSIPLERSKDCGDMIITCSKGSKSLRRMGPDLLDLQPQASDEHFGPKRSHH